MEPTIIADSIIYINRLAYLFQKPRLHDIIACRDPRDSKVIIKRIIKIENKRYFVQGDNTRYSTDSREFGMIGRRDIIGKILIL